MNATSILSKYDIPTDQTVHHAIWKVSDILDNASNFMATANALIQDLGGSREDNPVRARLFAKSLVEQAYLAGPRYDPEQASLVAKAKTDKISERIPYLFQGKDMEHASTIAPKKEVTSTRGGDKKEKAFAIFDANRSMAKKDVVKLIAKELSITEANARYYMDRLS